MNNLRAKASKVVEKKGVRDGADPMNGTKYCSESAKKAVLR
jgi:hypothetical protein